MKAGVFPLQDHYYEPLFDASALKLDSEPRALPGIDFGVSRQIHLLQQFQVDETLRSVPRQTNAHNAFYLDNGNFESGDAEIWYHVIRHLKPSRIFEIGSGHSTRMARLAIEAIRAEEQSYACDHVCVEPFEMPWLDGLGVRVIRKKVEEIGIEFFGALEANDILFIDSSHMIRPQGDVLFEYLQLIPSLKSGVIVHVHDIFSPRDYPREWLEAPRFWNEQYLLEAFLCHNHMWEVMLAVNLLKHEHYAELRAVCPHMDKTREPGSLYLRRI
jgi:hypothetical protein